MQAAPVENKLVFLVDDDADLRTLVGLWMRAANFEVVDCASGEECLSELSERMPAAVLLDLSMPGIGGLATLERILSLHRHLPVIVLTATREVETVVSTMQRGAYDFLPKPLDRPKLIRAVTNAVERLAPRLVGKTPRWSPQALALLSRYSFPGNVRELENVCQRAIVSCTGEEIEPRDVPGKLVEAVGGMPEPPPVTAPIPALAPAAVPATVPVGFVQQGEVQRLVAGGGTLLDLEKKAIEVALLRCNGNRSMVAQQLGIGRTTLYRKLKEFGFD